MPGNAAQVTRLISRYRESGVVRERSYRRHRFASRYTSADIEVLAAVDEAHEGLSGPATQKILYREYHDYGDERYWRLAAISVAHIYNLRQSKTYREKHAGPFWRLLNASTGRWAASRASRAACSRQLQLQSCDLPPAAHRHFPACFAPRTAESRRAHPPGTSHP